MEEYQPSSMENPFAVAFYATNFVIEAKKKSTLYVPKQEYAATQLPLGLFCCTFTTN